MQEIRADLNPDLEVLGILITFYNSRLKHHAEAIDDELQDLLKDSHYPIMKTRISRSVRVADGMGKGQSVATYAAGNKVAKQYEDLSKEVERWVKSK